ncbi:atrial natriuretic peptide-converting enzyme isoform X2 [Macrosteles quadrilineatus]|uniref:atrial natriuretic peptide-converting enzyme isoform X2 n=1 Tax=Macrosteles quadrilineatus TaxID=74068 RepID=UPI0023E24EC5|nr:atrial natriuretic peptide-converting enzyme isoform X2 [Macrosteles quadrilineatus]
MDNNNKRKGSWDSKISVSSVSTRPYWTRSETPSSILSSDSDIRFTRKLGDHYRCGCCILASFLVFILVGTLALYAGYTYLSLEPGGEQVFRGLFRVIQGDSYIPPLADPSTPEFKRAAREYREGLNLVYRRSHFRYPYLKSEVLAFDGEDNSDLIVHFNLYFDPRRYEIPAEELKNILARHSQSVYLNNRTLDLSSIHIYETSPGGPSSQSPSTQVTTQPPPTTTPAPRTCSPRQLPYCAGVTNNITTYPNLVGHQSLQEVMDDVIAFRELVDAECYRLAYQFVCHVLQPPCLPAEERGRPAAMIRPCRDFCLDFWSGCGQRLPLRFQDALDCSKFPSFSTVGEMCISKPGCRESLELRELSGRLCDGWPDCADLSDELLCPYCRPGHIHCPGSATCIPAYKRCNGQPDCPDHSDEKACLAVSPSIAEMPALRSAHPGPSVASGHVVFNEKGSLGKLCVDNLNHSLAGLNQTDVLLNVATSLCRTLLFQSVEEFHLETDTEAGVRNYVQMENPLAEQITFVQVPCPGRSVLHLTCKDAECGIQPAHRTTGVEGLGKMAALGDWPWHAALIKDGVHVCDATMVHPQWLLTSASCFQGQQKAEWVARFGSVRLTSTTPWQQERHIVGMTKSPVEGSTMVLVKLDSPLQVSDFVRPICLPRLGAQPVYTSCHTLGWTRNREVLQRVELLESNMDQCANISIMSVNALCANSVYSMEDCSEEELAGSPMICIDRDHWTLVGITNWRIACAAAGSQRPRMYDKTTPNVDWILTTIKADI